MRRKPIPAPPASIERLAAVRDALPAEADPAIDCCTRVIDRTAVETRDEAADLIAFCRALGLAAVEADGYRREPSTTTRPGPALEGQRLATTLRERVVGAAVVLGALEATDEPVSPEALFERLDASDAIPASERRRHGERLPAAWTDRVERILEWGVAFGAIERADGAYRPA